MSVDRPPSLAAAASRMVRAFLQFLWDYKFWWLMPIVLVFLVFLALILLGRGYGSLTPFIYDHS